MREKKNEENRLRLVCVCGEFGECDSMIVWDAEWNELFCSVGIIVYDLFIYQNALMLQIVSVTEDIIKSLIRTYAEC